MQYLYHKYVSDKGLTYVVLQNMGLTTIIDFHQTVFISYPSTRFLRTENTMAVLLRYNVQYCSCSIIGQLDIEQYS